MPKVNLAGLEVTRNLDADETFFAERELTHVMAKVFEKEYPALEALQMLPVDRSASEADRTILWHEYDAVGVAKITANYADDAPRVDVVGEEHVATIRGILDAYGYSVQDIRESQKTGRGLEQRKANAARAAIEQKKNSIGFYGDRQHGLNGLFTTSNTNDVVASTPAAGSSADLTWSAASGKTPTEILSDMSNLLDSVRSATNGVHRATTLVLPADAYAYVKNTPRSAGSDKSILTWFLDANPGVEVIDSYTMEAVTSLPSGASGTNSVAMAYVKDADLLAISIPMAFKQHPPQSRNLEFVVNCEERTGGVIVWKPLTISFMEGV